MDIVPAKIEYRHGAAKACTSFSHMRGTHGI
jgi:hypothetical protein